ncbi:HCL477Wp [Eremothecium sinecaudum]|uniref:Acetyltransferase component of pyruvate dehydrogenase complex n=1 Tax=Eremothecium sinecaudum TaxID=45286 RepID=A0A109UY64_9SACH|nr:HCL477Wp [Eremothecium sinecaudum]AMD19674.1 HCL477Wp [Eremothecium sinecaudum]
MSAFYRFTPSVKTLLRASQFQLRCYASYPSHTLINMPALSPTMTEGNLAVWTKKVGDQLAPGEVIAEIETDKAQMDFEFQEEGYLAKILVPEGTKDIPVNKPIAVYVEDEADVAAFKDFKVEEAAPAPAAGESKPAATSAAPAEKSSTASQPKKSAAPVSNRIIASPLAKTIALEKGIALREITGTGQGGRITQKDVENYLAKQGSSKSAGKAAASSSGNVSYEDVPITGLRKVIASRLLKSTQDIPSYIVSSNISVSKLWKLRASLNSSSDGKFKLSLNDLLIKALAVAAKRVPQVNSYWMEEQGVMRIFKNVDVSVAVATDNGLYTPIVKNAESKGLTAISAEVKDFVGRIEKLSPEEYQGGTICISNLGMNNAVTMFTSIINPPQSTIIAVSTVNKVAVEDSSSEKGFTFDQRINITGTFDHRTVDGAKAAEFMKELKNVIENPLELLL